MSRVMNDDVLKLILNYLTLKQKLQLERVSKQFQNCVSDVLRVQNSLLIGKSLQTFKANKRKTDNNCDQKWHNLNGNEFEFFGNQNTYHYLLSEEKSLRKVFDKCLNLRSISFNYLLIDLKTIEWVYNYCKRLECLIFINNKFNFSINDWISAQKLFNNSLIHLCFSETNLTLDNNALKYIVKNTAKLQSIVITENTFRTDEDFIYTFGQNLKTLKLINKKLTQNEVKNIAENNTRIQNLMISIVDNNGDEVLSLISQNMRQLRHLSLSLDTLCSGIKFISRLHHLQELNLEFRAKTIVNFSLIDRNFVLSSLKSLIIIDGAFTHSMINSISHLFPNLSQLTLKYCLFCCECSAYSLENNDCIECQEKCFKSISNLSELKILSLSFGLKFPINSTLISIFPLFKNLCQLELSAINLFDTQLQDLIIESLKTIADRDRKKLIKVRISGNLSQICDNKDLPKNLKITKYL